MRDAISLQHKLGQTTMAMTSQYVRLAAQHLAVINERVSPIDKLTEVAIDIGIGLPEHITSNWQAARPQHTTDGIADALVSCIRGA